MLLITLVIIKLEIGVVQILKVSIFFITWQVWQRETVIGASAIASLRQMMVSNLWVKIVSGTQMSFEIGIDFACSPVRLFLFLSFIDVDMVRVLPPFHAVIA